MTQPLIYLDYAAGTPLKPTILKESFRIIQSNSYNPLALYQGAQSAFEQLESCRRNLAQILAVKPVHLFFTPGATLANSWLITALKNTYPKGQLATLNIDHDSMKSQADYLLKVSPKTGQITALELQRLPDSIVCLSLAGINNEVGVIQPFALIKKQLKLIRQKREMQKNALPLFLHVDASQMVLTHQLQPQALAQADFLTLNGAKFYALRSSGMLYVKPVLKSPFLTNSPNERWLKSEESLLLAQSLTLALQFVLREKEAQILRLEKLKTWFEKELQELGGHIVLKDQTSRSPHIISVIFKGHDNETLALKLSLKNIYVGIGSACHSRQDLLKHSALKALGYKTVDIYAALRFSFGYETKMSHLKIALKYLKNLLN